MSERLLIRLGAGRPVLVFEVIHGLGDEPDRLRVRWQDGSGLAIGGQRVRSADNLWFHYGALASEKSLAAVAKDEAEEADGHD